MLLEFTEIRKELFSSLLDRVVMAVALEAKRPLKSVILLLLSVKLLSRFAILMTFDKCQVVSEERRKLLLSTSVRRDVTLDELSARSFTASVNMDALESRFCSSVDTRPAFESRSVSKTAMRPTFDTMSVSRATPVSVVPSPK